jgi:peptide/nickel transport system permease protein
MLSFAIRRLISAVPVFFGILAISFVFVQLLPGDPVLMMIGDTDSVTEEYLAQRRAALGLDRSLPVQFIAWMGQLSQGNLGYSFLTKLPVQDMLLERIGPTLLLAGSAMCMALLIGVPLGTWSALRQNTGIDYTAAVVSMLAISIPNFFLGLLGIFVFSLNLGILPSSGMQTPGAPFALVDLLRHLILPAGILSAVLIGPYVRYTRQGMLEVMRSDFIVTATAKGVPRFGVIFGHALRNALIPLTTVLAIQIPSLFAGAVVIETVFSWPGMGRLVLSSISQRDYPVILAVVLLSALLVMIFNFLADVVAGILDPRIRL